MTLQEKPRPEASQQRGWTVQILTMGWRLLLNAGSLVQLLQLLRLRPFKEVFLYNHRFAVKCLGHNYLARNVSARASLASFVHHYQRMHDSFPDRSLEMILYWDLPLYQTSQDGHSFSLSLGTSKPYDKEGELSLLLKVDSLIIFNLTFTIVPGWVVGSSASETLLISRLQGERLYADEIRLATKAMCNVRPRALLVAALQGIALALRIEEIDAVSGNEQSSYCVCCGEGFRNSYDEFFTELGLKKNDAGFFFGCVPFAEKPLELVDPNNRRTARKKQAFKAQIQMACAKSIADASGRVAREWESKAPSIPECLNISENALLDSQRS